jgi:hypothetical protein
MRLQTADSDADVRVVIDLDEEHLDALAVAVQRAQKQR